MKNNFSRGTCPLLVFQKAALAQRRVNHRQHCCEQLHRTLKPIYA
ncbi:hypothetical protein O9929_04605 [Vibrio lentus]|nr:hypothetical protein [Vibrio lentus]